MFMKHENNQKLEITNLNADNSGEFRCIASNFEGQVEKSFKVTLKEKAQIISAKILPSTDIRINSLTVTCVGKGHPNPTISWHDDKSLLTTTKLLTPKQLESTVPIYLDISNNPSNALEVFTSKDKFYSTFVRQDDGTMKFEITFNDKDNLETNNVKCKAVNQHGSVEETVVVKVEPYIKFSNGERGKRFDITHLVQAGKQLILECPIEGYPEPQIRWQYVRFVYDFSYKL